MSEQRSAEYQHLRALIAQLRGEVAKLKAKHAVLEDELVGLKQRDKLELHTPWNETYGQAQSPRCD